MSRSTRRLSNLLVASISLLATLATSAYAGEPKAKTNPGDQAPTKAPWRSVLLNRFLCTDANFGAAGLYPYRLTLDRVDFHETTMLWHFTAHAPKEQRTDEFFKSDTKLLNGQGQAVSLLGSSATYRKVPGGDEYYTIGCPAGEKKSFWLQFPLPKEEWAYYTLRLGKASMHVPEMTLHIPHRKPEPDAPVKEERVDAVAAEISINPKINRPIVQKVLYNSGEWPYLILIEKIEIMAVGDVRMHLKCANLGKNAFHDAVVIDLVGKGSHFRDERFKYPLIGSSLGTTVEGVHWAVPPQETKSFWLEFKGPFQGGSRFLLQFEGEMGIPPLPLVFPPAKKTKK